MFCKKRFENFTQKCLICRKMRALTSSLKNLKGMKVELCWKMSRPKIYHFVSNSKDNVLLKGFMFTSSRTKFLVATEVNDHSHHHWLFCKFYKSNSFLQFHQIQNCLRFCFVFGAVINSAVHVIQKIPILTILSNPMNDVCVLNIMFDRLHHTH